MPVPDEVKSSWAEEVELEGSSALPPSTEVVKNGLKIVTEYKYNDDKKVQIVRTYKIEKCIVSKSIALRKIWPKFGECANDKPGPNPATTIVSEDVYMQYISSKEEDNKQEEDALDKLKALGDKNVVKCRICNSDHWTSKCPWKDTILAGGKVPDDKKTPGAPGAGPSSSSTEAGKTGTKYIPPGMREGAKRGEGPNMQRRDDQTAIRIANLSESTTEGDLEELVKRLGPIQKLYLAKDKSTGLCKGFAYIHFKFKNDAAYAITKLDGHGYDHLILSADWSKPLNSANN